MKRLILFFLLGLFIYSPILADDYDPILEGKPANNFLVGDGSGKYIQLTVGGLTSNQVFSFPADAPTANSIMGRNADNTSTEYKNIIAVNLKGFTPSSSIVSDTNGYLVSRLLTREEFLSINEAEDGNSVPAAISILVATNKAKIRNFNGVSNEDVKITWQVPDDINISSGIKFKFVGYVSAVIAPADTEVIAYSLSGISLSNSESLSQVVGAGQTSNIVTDATYTQYDYLVGEWSPVIIVTKLTAGKIVHFSLVRLATTIDTYAQDFGLHGIKIKYRYSPAIPTF